VTRPPPVPAELPSLPRTAAGFTLRRELGRGGMGVVYEAQEIATGRTVALKVLLQELAVSGEAMERFQREARLAAAISHAHCVFVYGAHSVEGAPAIAMELIGGETLEDKIRRGEPIPIETAVRWTIDLLDGLDAAHRAGVLHRDIKPSNCFVAADGRLKVGDFGLSRSLERDVQLTQSGQFLGSPLYASPEQIRGRTLDARSDLYSCGATLYAILTGRPPFSGGNVGEVLARILSEDPPHPRSIRPSIPRALEVVVLRAMERDPEERWASLQEFREALEPFATTRTEVAARWRRIGAYVLDMTLPVFVIFPAFSWLPVHMVDMQSPPGHLLVGTLNIAYFALAEGLLGWTVGKWLLGLRVASIETREPSLSGAAIRAAVFLGPNTLIGFALTVWLHPIGPHGGYLQALVSTVFYVLMFVTARRRNGWRGIHEFASNTVVIPVSLPFLRARLQAPPPEMQLEMGSNLPTHIGAYAVEGVVGITPSGSMLKARDSSLERSVWIHVPTVPGALVDGGRRSLARSSRLRWLDVVRTDTGDADVFESPGGSSLPVFSQRHGSIDWPNAQRLMLALVEELSLGAFDTRGLALEQVWIDRNWDVRLLDEPVGHGPFLRLEPLDLVHAAARALFVGGTSNAPTLPQDLPVHAEEAVNRLMGSESRFEDMGSIRDALMRLSAGPALVSRRSRAAQLAINVMLPSAFVALIIVAAYMFFGMAPRLRGVLPMSLELAKNHLVEETDPPLRPDSKISEITITYGAELTPDQFRAREILVADASATAIGAQVLSTTDPVLHPAIDAAREHQKHATAEDVAWAESLVQAEPGMTGKRRSGSIDERLGSQGQTHVVAPAEDIAGIRHDFASAAAAVSIGLWALFAIPLAFALRGGLTFTLFGIRVRDRRGRRAARWLCSVRCFIAWLPFAIAAVVVWKLAHTGHETAATSIAIGGGLVLVAAVADAIVHPARCLVDRLLRTRLVPR
jgi:uncharacterized RDD family membrane protein YckC